MSSRSDRASGSGSSRSRRKHNKSESYGSLPAQPESSELYEGEAMETKTWPDPTFLFTINELPVNEEPTQGGEAPRADENGHWCPPVRSNGFGTPTPSRIYRWAENGRISSADDCQWFNRQCWYRSGALLTEYKNSTIFYCNDFTRFMVATGDASLRHMNESDERGNRWWPLAFRHEGTLSRVEEGGLEQRLAGTGDWVNLLGLRAYRNKDHAGPGGLAGNLAIVIGLVAFTCQSKDLDTVLLHDRAWWRRRCVGHRRDNGRNEMRGFVVTVYLDPENPQGSTFDTLLALEWSGPALLG